MNLQVDLERIQLAQKAIRAELLAERNAHGYWDGYLSSSPLATATAISALVVAHQPDTGTSLSASHDTNAPVLEQLVQTDLSEFLVESVHWLAQHQNEDGGWGDSVGAKSSLAATLLVQAAFRLTGVPAKYDDLVMGADQYIAEQGGTQALWARYGDDKAFPTAVLANCALAGMINWRQVPILTFERIAAPTAWQRRLQVVPRYATPLLIAVGFARFHHRPPRNPISRLLRRGARAHAVAALERLQASDDSFLASTPCTAFVVMSLASSGRREHPIVRRGVEFLLSLARSDASWPIGAPPTTNNSALALESLADSAFIPRRLARSESRSTTDSADRANHSSWAELAASNGTAAEHAASERNPAVDGLPVDTRFPSRSLEWLLRAQRTTEDELTGAPAGGWAASHTSGALTNARDTALALLALARRPWPPDSCRSDVLRRGVQLGINWLLACQKENGGWPFLYGGSTATYLYEPSSDVAAAALRALAAWQHDERLQAPPELGSRMDAALERGWQFLASCQRSDGSFVPQLFGNEHHPEHFNLVCGTALVLTACADLGRLESSLARRAAHWLVAAQHTVGGWGPPRARRDYSGSSKEGFRAWRANEAMSRYCTVEETSLAISALLPLADANANVTRAVGMGLNWLAAAIEQDAHRHAAVIGYSPWKIWYHERLYPLVFAAGALSQAVRQLEPRSHEAAPVA